MLYVSLLYEKTVYKLKLEVILNSTKMLFSTTRKVTENKYILFLAVFFDRQK
jgi:hypothetical protein